MVGEPGHLPLRPSWTCAWCAEPWPCASKQRRLIAEYEDAHISLYLLMAMRLVDAAGDLRDLPAGELHTRFLGWIGWAPQ